MRDERTKDTATEDMATGNGWRGAVRSIGMSLAFLAVLGLCITAAILVLRRKDSDYKYKDFFDKAAKEQIDVLFIGSSHVINAINPAVLFDTYGITSYNMGGHGSVMQATYWELREALTYCTPKYVVVATFLMQKDYQHLHVLEETEDADAINTSVQQLHLNMDAWPLSKLKVEAIQDLIKDPKIQKEFLFDFVTYHSRWQELDENDVKAMVGKGSRNTLFGAEMRYDVELTPGIYPDPMEGEMLAQETVGCRYLEKIIETCKENNIGVLVTFYPCSATTEDKRVANTAAEIAKKHGVPFVDFMKLNTVDLYTDLNDTGHLNAKGAIKVTTQVGELLKQTGIFADHRGQEGYEDWQAQADDFKESLKELVITQENLYRQLQYLSLQLTGCIIYLNEGSEVFRDAACMHLIQNISGTDTITKTDGPYLLINDVKSGKVYEACESETLDEIPTALGIVEYYPVEQGFRMFHTKEEPEVDLLYNDEKAGYDIQVIPYDADTGEIFAHAYYRSYGCRYEP